MKLDSAHPATQYVGASNSTSTRENGRDGLSGSATQPSNCTRLWCSKYNHSTGNIFRRKAKCVAQDQNHRETDPLECPCQVQHQCHCSQFFFSCSLFEPLHLQQNFSHCSLSSSFSAINSVPINAVLLLPLRHLKCSQSFPPTYQRRHKRNRPLTRAILRAQEEHCRVSLLRPFRTLFHLLPLLLLFLFSSLGEP